MVPIQKVTCQLKGQRVLRKALSPFNSPISPVQKYNGKWRLTVGYRALNEVTTVMSAAVIDMLELQL